MLDKVLAIDHRNGVVGKRKALAEIQMQIGRRAHIDVEPARLHVRAAAEVQLQLAAVAKTPELSKRQAVLMLNLELAPQTPKSLPHRSRRPSLHDRANHQRLLAICSERHPGWPPPRRCPRRAPSRGMRHSSVVATCLPRYTSAIAFSFDDSSITRCAASGGTSSYPWNRR
jgi:hypothetical protein